MPGTQNCGLGRCNCKLAFTLTHVALFKGTEMLAIINNILVHNN